MALEQSYETGGNAKVRVLFTLTATFMLSIAISLSGLAASGDVPFSKRNRNVSDIYNTCFTPAGFTFSIWIIIYIGLVLIVIYSISLLFRKCGDNPVWRLGGAVPASFLLVFIINMIVNVIWLVVRNKLLMTASIIFSLYIVVTNGIALSLSAYWFMIASSDLLLRSRSDFWCGVFVINAYCIYTTWSIMDCILNLAVFLIYEVLLDSTTVCISMLSFLPALMSVMAALETFVFVEMFNSSCTAFFVYLWGSFGIYWKNKDTNSTALFGLLWANIAMAATLSFARVVVVSVRNCRRRKTNDKVEDISDTSMLDQRY